jgi:two-component system nitrate/nitrite response regulator NarL
VSLVLGPRIRDTPSVTPTTLIVDDHDAFRVRARRLLEAGGLDVIGEAADADAAIAAVDRLRPELVLLDIDLGTASGFDVARRLTQDDDGPDVILISSHEYLDFGAEIAACGARGFLAKDALSVAAVQKALS